EKNFYSVPYSLIGQAVDLRVTAQLVEVYRNHERLTSHLLFGEHVTNEYRTNDADQPQGEKYREWDTVRIRAWAERVGPQMVTVVSRIFESVPVEEQGFDAALAVLRLTRRYSSERVEHACQIALESRVRSPRYAHLRPILETGQDRAGTRRRHRFEDASPEPEPGGYVRGAGYYAGGSTR
ncbi:IS21 family transposase, partial [Subtercola boreus]